MLVVLPITLFLPGFHSSPMSHPFFLFAVCPSDSHTSWKDIPRTMHQLTHQGLQDGGRHCPGCHLERWWTRVGSVPQDLCQLTQGELFRRQGMGAWGGDSPCLGLYLRRYAYRLQRECWMPWCLKQGRGFSGFMSGHRTRRANQVPSPLLERPQSKNVQLSPDPVIKDTALESSWVTQSWASGGANTTA